MSSPIILKWLRYRPQDVFDSIDVEQKGTLTKAGISKAAAELGFPLSQAELQKAVSEMDTDKSLGAREAQRHIWLRNGEVHFPEFLAWWNSPPDHERCTVASCQQSERKTS